MTDVTIDAAQLQALLDTVKSQNKVLERLQRSEAERVREDAARQENRQRQHSVSIAATQRSGIGDAPTKSNGTRLIQIWAVLPLP